LYQAAKRRKTLVTWIELVVVVGFFWLLSIATTRGENLPPRAPIVSDDLDRESLRRALRQSQAYLQKLPPDGVVGEQPKRITAKEVLESLAAFDGLLDRWDCRECWIKAVTERFDFIPSSNDPELQKVLFTGYYDPVIDGSLAPTSEYVYPIYSKPADLIEVEQMVGNSGGTRDKMVGRMESESLVPYYSRREIDRLRRSQRKSIPKHWQIADR
jgi:membrane-bound lytic murein transglycosylase A